MEKKAIIKKLFTVGVIATFAIGIVATEKAESRSVHGEKSDVEFHRSISQPPPPPKYNPRTDRERHARFKGLNDGYRDSRNGKDPDLRQSRKYHDRRERECYKEGYKQGFADGEKAKMIHRRYRRPLEKHPDRNPHRT